MTSREFCYWLQGFFEISGKVSMDADQCEMVRRHLSLVFQHDIDSPDPTGALQAAHDGKPAPQLPAHMRPGGSGLARC